MIDRSTLTRFAVISGAVLAVILIGAVLYNVLVFRVTSTTPNPNKFPEIAPYIDIYFSKPIKEVEGYTLNDQQSPGTLTIEDKKLRFTYNSSYIANTDYTLSLKGITSTSGDRMDYIYAFTALYMNFADVPKEIQQASIDESSSGQIDDPFFNNYFPMQTSDFMIEHPRNLESSEELLVVTFLKEVYNYDTNTRVTVPDSEAEGLRQKVLDYIKSRGGEPDKYHISYDNEYLENKYSKEHSHD